MLVGFGEFSELGLVLNFIAGQVERHLASSGVGINVGDTFDFFQIASDRRGTTTSHHVGNVQGNQSHPCRLDIRLF